MNAARLSDFLKDLIDTWAEALGEPELDGATVGTFADAGVVVTLEDGSEFQISVVQSRSAH